MATSRRSLVIDSIVNPAIMSGLGVIVDTITNTATSKVLTYTFPAKSIIGIFTSSNGDVDAEKVVWAASVTADVATVTFTAATASSITYSIMIWYTKTETLDTLSIADDTSLEAVK